MLEVKIDKFTYEYTEVLKNLNFVLEEDQHLAVLGESGSGKSTLLHIIYGLLDLPEGQVIWRNKLLGGPKQTLIPGHEFMKLVAQEFDIMPYISVAENIGSYLTKQDMEADEARINELLEVVDLVDYKHVFVKNLSGGQKQRVALAKALANAPEILLLDEPFSHIDFLRKSHLRRKLFTYLKKNNIACIYATHDSDEALAFSDKILLLSANGTQELFDTPEKVYQSVSTAYQASFFGEANDVSDWIKSDKAWYYAHELKIAPKGPIRAKLINSYFKGAYYLLELESSGKLIYVNHNQPIVKGEKLYIDLR